MKTPDIRRIDLEIPIHWTGEQAHAVFELLDDIREKILVNHEASPTAIAAIISLLPTGCRRLEILRLKWDQVDFKGNCLCFGVE